LTDANVDKSVKMEYAVMEPEIGDLALNIVRGTNAGRFETTNTN
jgi:hypothetical protein